MWQNECRWCLNCTTQILCKPFGISVGIPTASSSSSALHLMSCLCRTHTLCPEPSMWASAIHRFLPNIWPWNTDSGCIILQQTPPVYSTCYSWIGWWHHLCHCQQGQVCDSGKSFNWRAVPCKLRPTHTSIVFCHKPQWSVPRWLLISIMAYIPFWHDLIYAQQIPHVWQICSTKAWQQLGDTNWC